MNKIKKDLLVLFLTLIICFSVVTYIHKVYALDEFIDDYNNENFVQSKYNVVRNTTFNAMELDYIIGPLWKYRKLQNITGSTNDDVTDYQILIKIHYGDGVDSQNNVYMNETCQVDFDDIRFYDADEITELDYWLERKVNSDYADFWVKILSILKSPVITPFYIHWGNMMAVTTSNMNNTFPIYANDFENYNLEETPFEWEYDAVDSTATIANDRVYAGTKSLKHTTRSGFGGWMRLNATKSGDYEVAWTLDGVRIIYYYQFDLAQRWNLAMHDKDNIVYSSRLCRDDQNDWRYLTSVWNTIPNVLAPQVDTWRRMEEIMRETDVKWNLQTAYGTSFSGWIIDSPASPDGSWMYYRIGVQSTYQADPVWIDDFVVGKYISPEPTHTGWGDLEEGTGGHYEDGYFYTTEIVSGVGGYTIALLTNTTIPTGDIITVEFSNDNLTWLDHNGNVGFDTLVTGNESIDLRDLSFTNLYSRFSFIDGDVDSTPRLYQIRVITSAIVSGMNVTGAWIDYNFTSITTLVGNNTGGNFLNATYFKEGYNYNVSEIGTPAIDVRFNISGLPDGLICLNLINYLSYDGSTGHTFQIEVYNFTGSSWDLIADIPDACCQWFNNSLESVVKDYVKDGLLMGRFYHPSPANINHLFALDYGKLRAFSPYPVSVISGVYTGWILGIFILVPSITILIWSSKRSKRR